MLAAENSHELASPSLAEEEKQREPTATVVMCCLDAVCRLDLGVFPEGRERKLPGIWAGSAAVLVAGAAHCCGCLGSSWVQRPHVEINITSAASSLELVSMVVCY